MSEEKLSAEQKLSNIQNELNSLKRIGLIFGSSLQIDKLLSLVVEEVCDLLNADRGTLFLVDDKKGILWSKVALRAEIATIEIPIGKGIAGHVAKTGEIINIPDAYNDSRFNREVDKKTGYHTKAILCVPLRKPVLGKEKKGEIIGVIQLLNKKNNSVFSQHDEELLLSFGGSIASSINNANLFHQLQQQYQEMELLYSTEHLIASNYNLDSLFEELLSQFLKYLNLKAGGVLLKESGNYRTFWKILFKSTAPLISQNLMILPSGMPFQLKKITTISEDDDNFTSAMSKYYQELGLTPHKILLVPLKSGKEYLGNLQLLFARNENEPTVHEHVWEVIASQIARAYELFKMREGLMRNERLSLLGNMMSLIVHDLRSPLNNIIGFTDLMTDKDTTYEERKEYKEIIKKEIDLMTNMTREILDFAKGKSNILPGKVGVTELCKAFIEKIKLEMVRNKVELKFGDFPRGKLWVDKERILRAFTNITKNAVEAMHDQKREKKIIFTVDANKDEYIFHIKDTGPGIPEAIQNNLFDEYVTSGKESGTGLGLAIVKKIVEEHKGKIEFNSTMGHGTEFIITLPGFEKIYR